MHLSSNPDYFAGTVLEAEATKLLEKYGKAPAIA
jgi:hypothetical protein